MDGTTFRILDVLSRNLGSPISINEIKNRIGKIYSSAYYKNIYERIQDLERQKIIMISKIGRSTTIELNFANYLLIDILAEMELKRNKEFLGRKTEMQMLLLETKTYFNSFPSIGSISIIGPEKNLKLNRAEFLILLRKSPEIKEIMEIHKIMQLIQSIHNIKLDYLILKENEFLDLLKSNGGNPLKEMLSDKIVFFSPQSFWLEIKSILTKGIQIKLEKTETNPAKISDRDIVYNLSRFGYKEMGLKIEQGRDICIELVITSVLLHGSARRIEAIPILLAKNKINYNMLFFLCQKYGQLEKLFGLLRIFHRIKGDEEAGLLIRILEEIKTKETRFGEKNIKEKMRLYNAI